MISTTSSICSPVLPREPMIVVARAVAATAVAVADAAVVVEVVAANQVRVVGVVVGQVVPAAPERAPAEPEARASRSTTVGAIATTIQRVFPWGAPVGC